MKFKNALVLTLLVSLMTLSLMIGPAYLEDGPRSDDVLIHIYLNPDAENYALEAGELDINDWPLAKEWIDDWSEDPNVQLRGYAEIGMMEFDLNNQMWPTGVSLPRTLDPNTGTYKHWYGDSEWDDEAREFRKALAYLTDKDAYVSNILKGYGYRMDSMVPTPALAGFIPGDLPTYPYSPATAAAVLDAAGFVLGDDAIRDDPKNGGNLAPLEMYVRIDDPNRREAGEMLRDDLLAIGIPVNCHITEKSVCYDKAMVEYDYHIYTGGWSLTADIDFVYWLWSADMYFGGTETSALNGVGWSLNYPGYCNHNFETEAGKILTAVDPAEVRAAVFEAQRVAMGDVCIIPLWCSAAQKAYKTGWDGVVNTEGFGIDNYWTFLNMEKTDDDTIDYGFKSNLEGPSVICAEWLWDWNLLGLMYDSLIGLNPFNYALDTGFLAESWSTGYWDTTPGDEKMYALFTLKAGTVFHDGTTVTPEDVKFSLEFTRDCGPGVAWNYASASDIDHVDTQAEDGGLGPLDVKVYFTYASYWMLHWAGGLPIINKDLWMAAIGPGTAADYNPVTHTFGGTAMAVRDYHPWNADANENDVIDLKEDGTGAWSYVSTEKPDAISASTWVLMTANREYYMTQTEVSNNLLVWFHAIGDVNEDEVINIVDLALIARALGTDDTMLPWGTGWDDYNPEADLNQDGYVNLFDLYSAGRNFGRVFG